MGGPSRPPTSGGFSSSRTSPPRRRPDHVRERPPSTARSGPRVDCRAHRGGSTGGSNERRLLRGVRTVADPRSTRAPRRAPPSTFTGGARRDFGCVAWRAREEPGSYLDVPPDSLSSIGGSFLRPRASLEARQSNRARECPSFHAVCRRRSRSVRAVGDVAFGVAAARLREIARVSAACTFDAMLGTFLTDDTDRLHSAALPLRDSRRCAGVERDEPAYRSRAISLARRTGAVKCRERPGTERAWGC